MPVHVLIVIHSLGPGGAERVVSSLVAGHVRRGDRVDLVTFTNTRRSDLFFELDPAVGLYPLGIARPARNLIDALLSNLVRAFRLRRLVRKLDPQLVVSHLVETNVITLLALIGSGYPVMVTEHTDPYVYRPGRPWGLLRKILYRTARRIVVLTKHSTGYFGQQLARRVVTIPNPVQERFHRIERSGSPKSSVAVTYLGVGRLDRGKRFDMMIEAFSQVHRVYPESRLVIAGDGPERSSLESLARTLDIGDSVEFAGYVADVADCYRAATVLVSTSTLEGFPVAVSEAMVSGLPVIVTEYGAGTGELVDNGVNGVVVGRDDRGALVDAMLWLARDRAARDRLGKGARQLFQQVSPEVVMDMWEKQIKTVIEIHAR